MQGAGHLYFIWATGDQFTEEIVASIEGTDDSDFKIMSLFEVGKQLAQRWGHVTPQEVQTMTREVGGNVVEKYQGDYGPYVGFIVGTLVLLLVLACCCCCCCMVGACCMVSCCAQSFRKKSHEEQEFKKIE